MYIRDLDVRDFRSWPELTLRLKPGITLFVGRNGFGKTNIVEPSGIPRIYPHTVWPTMPPSCARAHTMLVSPPRR